MAEEKSQIKSKERVRERGEVFTAEREVNAMLDLVKDEICGPIGFISLGVPNLSRIVCKSTDIRKHYLISSAMGVGLLIVTYLVVKYVSFGIYLPISATMAIIALPLMVVLFVKK